MNTGVLPHTNLDFISLKGVFFCFVFLLPVGFLISSICSNTQENVKNKYPQYSINGYIWFPWNGKKKSASTCILWRDKLTRYVFIMHTALTECLLDILNDHSIIEPLGTCFLAKLSFTTHSHKDSLHLIWIDEKCYYYLWYKFNFSLTKYFDKAKTVNYANNNSARSYAWPAKIC